jgi:O-acetyl-ADP-ribose deacetylase (regulator of RNase III)
MRYHIIHPDGDLAEVMVTALNRLFKVQGDEESLASAEVGTLQSVFDNGFQCDALITPGNSYGDMTGGFDLAVVEVFGQDIQAAVHEVIRKSFMDELNVGQAIVVDVPFDVWDKRSVKKLIYAPTMRYPRPVHRGSDAAYASLLASFQRIDQIVPEVQSIAMTFHCHGYGQMHPNIIVHQTVEAVARFQYRNRQVGRIYTQI